MSPSKKYKLSLERTFYIWILLFFIGVLGYLNYQILKSFFVSAGWAIVIAMVFYPVHEFLVKLVKYKGVAAAVTVILVILLFTLPFFYISYQIAVEATEVAKRVDFKELITNITSHPILYKIIHKLISLTGGDVTEFESIITREISNLMKEGVLRVAHGVGSFISFAINVVLTFFIAFFFLKDGDIFVKKIAEFLPFSEADKIHIRNQIKNIIYTTFYGGVFVAMIQGSLLGLTFYFLNIPSATLWGFATAVASFIPLLGAFSVWGPFTVYLFVKGYILKGIILLLVGVLLISSIDNILKPLIIKGRVDLPLIFIFLSVLGGIKFFGIIGFIIGPLVFSLFVLFLEILKNYIGGTAHV
ncbi:MAG: AI-2E family transporter [Thermodesulfovibrio sp.]|nr:AI-2E family transporter [Thermodesulfovibrio sp.]